MTTPLLSLQKLEAAYGQIVALKRELGEITITVAAKDYLSVAKLLRDHSELRFEQLIDLCGVDYSTYKDGAASIYSEGPRFCVVSHLLSVSKNWRLRLKVFATDDNFPVLASVNPVWNSANWFEREAFDLYGIVFDGHEDLRRILTDYGFIGHPFRKDFPLEGHVEVRYDPDKQRVVYQPVSIENRTLVPRVIRSDSSKGH